MLAKPQVARHLLDDCSNGTLELFNSEKTRAHQGQVL